MSLRGTAKLQREPVGGESQRTDRGRGSVSSQRDGGAQGGSQGEAEQRQVLRIAKEAIGEYLVEAQISWKVISDNYRSENPPLEPTVALVVSSGSLEFTVSYVVDYTKRTAMKDQLFTKIMEEVSNSNGQLECASSAVTLMSQPATPAAIEAHRPSSTQAAGKVAGSH